MASAEYGHDPGNEPGRVAGYRVLRRLGEDVPAVRYLAGSPGGAQVVMTVIREAYAGQPAFRAAFTRDMATVRGLYHRLVVPVLAADCSDSGTWLATPYLPVPTLAEALEEHGRLPRRSVQLLGALLAEALEAVHATGLVHGNLTPGQVLLTPDGPRLAGLGTAPALAAVAPCRETGSPGFLAPEQEAGGSAGAGPAGDIFSLGCVLALAASGRPPFGGGSVEQVLHRTEHAPADLADVPRILLEVVEACLSRDVDTRPTATDLWRELGPVEEPGSGWLPEPVSRMVAERRAAGDHPPAVGRARHARSPAAAPPAPSRRRILGITGAAGMLAVGGGVTAWALSRPGADSVPAGPGQRYFLGLHADLTGPLARYGRAQERGATLAVAEFAHAGDLPYEVVLRVLDDGGDPARAAGIAEELAADSSVLAVIGPTSDEAARAAAGVYEAHALPWLPLSPGEFLAEADPAEHRSLLPARPPAGQQGQAICRHLEEELQAGRIGLVDDRTAGTYSWEVTRALTATLDRGRTQLVPRVVPHGTEDFGPVVRHFLDEEVDAVVYGGGLPGAAGLAGSLHEAGFTGPRCAADAALRPEFLERAGVAADGWLFTAPFTDPVHEVRAAGFGSVFRSRFGEAAEPYAVEAYDAARLLARTVRKMHGVGVPSRPEAARRLRGVRYRGVAGELVLAGDAGDARDGLYLYRVEQGVFRYRGPAPAGER
ncbi:ABC transporter substrate-binding protein [Streptomyces sp. ACA25]|uniref:ABC transporter substrate-binding protein n=1 Tax=Streptomyces sp. ACA25 TaxID=3022596 RepID=UPI002306F72C|nr:ABC transporter substrate-binding protein [Streptomyces sp. ACA25]MDB1089763.1 ABC transporter substrate-binding protein [Streptomyces sp. ACA25]